MLVYQRVITLPSSLKSYPVNIDGDLALAKLPFPISVTKHSRGMPNPYLGTPETRGLLVFIPMFFNF